MARPRIRHLAIKARDTEKLARFYKDVFQMEELNRQKSDRGNQPAIYLTDGYINLALLPFSLQAESTLGLNHFGWKVDDVDGMNTLLVESGVEEPKMRPANRIYAEFRGCDLEGYMYDLSVHGFDDVETRSDREKKKQSVPAE